jgi:hypothetical protein
MIPHKYLSEAISELYSDLEYTISGTVTNTSELMSAMTIYGNTIVDFDTVVSNAQAKQEADNGYELNRAMEYPVIGEQLDKLYHDIDGGLLGEDAKTGSWYLAIKAVKDNNPKPSE